MMTAKVKENQHQQSPPLPSPLSPSDNDISVIHSSSLSDTTEPTGTETHQRAPCVAATKQLGPVVLTSNKGDQDEVSWADVFSSQPDHRQCHRPQQEQQSLRSNSRDVFPPQLTVSTTRQETRQRSGKGAHDKNINNNNKGQGPYQDEKQAEAEKDCTTSSSLSSLLPSSPLPTLAALPSLVDKNPSSLLPSSSSFAYNSSLSSPLSPPDSANTPFPPLSILSPSSLFNSVTVDNDLSPARVVNCSRGNVLHKSTSVGSTNTSENSNPFEEEQGTEEEPSSSTPGQADPAFGTSSHSPTRSPSQTSVMMLHPLEANPTLSSLSSLSSSYERRGNKCGRPELARTKRRRSTDDSDDSDSYQKGKGDSNNDNNGVRDQSPSLSTSPIELDRSSSPLSLSKGLVASNSELTTENSNPAMNSQMTSFTATATIGSSTALATHAAEIVPSSSELERRRGRGRRRTVSFGHDTITPTKKATKKSETVTTVASTIPSITESLDRTNGPTVTAPSPPPSQSTTVADRPSCSYTTMIMEVFQASSKIKLDLPDIYGGVMSRYPYYRKADKVWQSSVRHALSQSKFFCKVERGPDEPGKGNLWIVDTQNKQTPNPSRKRKASSSSIDIVKGAGHDVGRSADSGSNSHFTARKQACRTISEDGEKLNGFHQHSTTAAASIPSPAASDDADDLNTVRRSGRARRPPRTKEADDYVTIMTAVATTTPGRKTPHLDLELAGIPGVVNSPRIRRPPQKLAEFVSSEDFKASPCGKRPHSSISTLSPTMADTTLMVSSSPSSSSALASVSEGMEAEAGLTPSPRVERRGRKRIRPIVDDNVSTSPSQQHRVSSRKNRKRAAAVDIGSKEAKALARQQRRLPSTSNTIATARSPVSPCGSDGVPAFISLKDLELSHTGAASPESYDDEEDEDYFGDLARQETYKQRRLAGIQQIVVASLDWYDESDSDTEDEDKDLEMDVEGHSDNNLDSHINNSHTDIGTTANPVTDMEEGRTVRSGFDSGFDSGSDSCKGFIRETGWTSIPSPSSSLMTVNEKTDDHTVVLGGLDMDVEAVTQALEHCPLSSQEAYETVCIAPDQILNAITLTNSDLEATTATTMASVDFLEPVMSAGARLSEQDDSASSQADLADAVGTTSLLPAMLDAASPFGESSVIDDVIAGQRSAASWVVPILSGGMLKELVAASTVNSGDELIAGPIKAELEEEHNGDASVHIEISTASTATMELKVDNYMGWLNI
ncbi:Forkhead box protein K1 [Linnemannia zychae]|nr:Forkhead box protein K1 [Linnemannia zychae]